MYHVWQYSMTIYTALYVHVTTYNVIICTVCLWLLSGEKIFMVCGHVFKQRRATPLQKLLRKGKAEGLVMRDQFMRNNQFQAGDPSQQYNKFARHTAWKARNNRWSITFLRKLLQSKHYETLIVQSYTRPSYNSELGASRALLAPPIALHVNFGVHQAGVKSVSTFNPTVLGLVQ